MRLSHSPAFSERLKRRADEWTEANPKKLDNLSARLYFDREMVTTRTLVGELAASTGKEERNGIRAKIFKRMPTPKLDILKLAGMPPDELALFQEIHDGAPLPAWAQAVRE